ncbi:NRAMP-like transporter smf-3 [Rachicladosporium monterosium]|uniref:NRAMP-like transporter smf-3 n=1 Tax=Rachicladosporium monterosium TaxID=1507873 RepID=A0ABR0L697_9PEZI|nr:NRAMP-like transporter smf-3 [Rachicladosporium monterosium]
MNCPSKTEPEVPDDWNQNPNDLNGDTTTRSDLSRIANARLQRDHRLRHQDVAEVELVAMQQQTVEEGKGMHAGLPGIEDNDDERAHETGGMMLEQTLGTTDTPSSGNPSRPGSPKAPLWRRSLADCARVLLKYVKFIGPGFMISVAYIDPGNYATDVGAGATYRFKLLFVVLMSNLFAIFLQSLCIKLGTVTGLNLAEMYRAHMPPWLNYTLYGIAEAAIIATDIAEVIGTAIALNLLSNGRIPLVAGCALSIVDVLFILLFYQSSGRNMKALRAFEFFVILLVLGVVVCFCFQLSLIQHTDVGEVFHGFLPSRALVQGRGLYQACGILGATVMPHSLYLGSGIVQARLQEFDLDEKKRQRHETNSRWPHDHHPAQDPSTSSDENDTTSSSSSKYRPSLPAIKACMSYSITELALSLFTFALFVNSAILIVAGASLSQTPAAATADLFSIYHLLSRSLAPAAGTIFALALLLSGTSAGIVCTIAGQMVSEGQLNLRFTPWVRRLMTRSISITPSIIIAGAVGAKGLSAALEGTQVALSVILPFVSAPLIYFTCRDRYMTVGVVGSAGGSREGGGAGSMGQGSGGALHPSLLICRFCDGAVSAYQMHHASEARAYLNRQGKLGVKMKLCWDRFIEDKNVPPVV